MTGLRRQLRSLYQSRAFAIPAVLGIGFRGGLRWTRVTRIIASPASALEP